MSAVERIATPEPLSSCLDDLGIEVTTWGHERVFTVDEGQDVKACLKGGHTKNLFLKDKKGVLWLVVANQGGGRLARIPVSITTSAANEAGCASST